MLRHGLNRRQCFVPFRRPQRNFYEESCSLAGGGFHLDGSAVLFNDLSRYHQTESRPFGSFRRVKLREQVLPDILWNPDAVVGHLDKKSGVFQPAADYYVMAIPAGGRIASLYRVRHEV